METIAFRARPGKKGTVTITVPARLRSQELEMIVIMNETDRMENGRRNYDFSDLSGKLKWKGNAVSEQRRLRREWR